MSLQTLPHELLRAIILEVDDTSLHSLSSSCRLFYYLTIRDIYQFIFSWDGGYQGYTFPLSQSSEWPTGITRQTRVFDLMKLLRTVEESPLLASYIMAVGFHFEKGSGYCSLKSNVTTKIMEKLSDSTFVHISPPSLRLADGIISGPVSAIDFSPYCWSRDGSSQGFSNLPKDILYNLFRYPSLRQLSLGGIRSWDRFADFDDNNDIQTSPNTSNVTTLMLPNTVPVGEDLEEILAWPRALETFHMEAWPWADNNFGPGGPIAQILSPARVKSALSVQRHSLREIYICGSPDSRGIEASKLGSLREFSKLQRLGIPQGFVKLNDMNNDYVTEDENYLNLRHCLPASIQELQIELPLDFKFTNSKNSTKLTSHGCELATWLEQLKQDRNTLYPNLKRLAFWQRQLHSELPSPELKPDFSNDVEFLYHREFMKGILPFKVGSILVTIEQSYHPPLFGKRERFENVKLNEARCFQHSSRSLPYGAPYHDETERLMEWGFCSSILI